MAAVGVSITTIDELIDKTRVTLTATQHAIDTIKMNSSYDEKRAAVKHIENVGEVVVSSLNAPLKTQLGSTANPYRLRVEKVRRYLKEIHDLLNIDVGDRMLEVLFKLKDVLKSIENPDEPSASVIRTGGRKRHTHRKRHTQRKHHTHRKQRKQRKQRK